MMATAGLLKHLTIPWNLLCQVMAELGCPGESLKALVSRAARAKEGIWVQLALHMTRKKKSMVSGAGEIAQSVKCLPGIQPIPNTISNKEGGWAGLGKQLQQIPEDPGTLWADSLVTREQ